MRPSGGFTLEATVAAVHANTPDLGHPHTGGRSDGQRAAGAGTGRRHQAARKRQPCSWAAGGPGSRPRRSRWAASSGRWLALHRGKGHRVEQQCAPAADENPGPRTASRRRIVPAIRRAAHGDAHRAAGVRICVRHAYARDAFPQYAGKKISATKVSRVVGVVFAGERSSRIFMWPELSASAISSNRSAMLDDIPIWISTGFNCAAGTWLYARSALPIAAPTIFATSDEVTSRVPCSSCVLFPTKSNFDRPSAAKAPISRVAIIGKGKSALTGPAKLPMDLITPAWGRRFSMKQPARRKRAF